MAFLFSPFGSFLLNNLKGKQLAVLIKKLWQKTTLFLQITQPMQFTQTTKLFLSYKNLINNKTAIYNFLAFTVFTNNNPF